METNSLFEFYEQSKLLKITETENFLKFNPKRLSSYQFQNKRFHFDEEGNLKLFNNQIRKDLISEIMRSNDAKIFITGPRGVGKSHILALLTLYYRENKNKKYRVFFINNPLKYFADPIECFLNDLIYFAGDEIKANVEILKKFENVQNSRNFSEPIELLSMIIIYLKEQDIECFLLVDQQNLIDCEKHDFPEIGTFLSSLKLKFKKVIISASNTNKTFYKYKEFGTERVISGTNIFSNDEEKKSFMKELNYFGKREMSNDFFDYISEITNFVPLEISNLSQSYLEVLNLKKNESEENIMKKAKNQYFKLRKMEIEESHRKFIQEYLTTDTYLISFINFISIMDNKEIKKNFMNYRNCIDYNCMEVDFNNGWISSVCPAAKMFLKEKYDSKYIYELQPAIKNQIMENHFLNVKEYGMGDSYESLVKNWLADPKLKFLKFENDPNNRHLNIPSSFHHIWTKNLNLDFSKDADKVGDYIYSIQDGHFDLIDLVYFKNSASKSQTNLN